MKVIAARIPLIVTGVVLLAGMLLLATSRLEYCGRPEIVRLWLDTALATNSPAPTLAPPLKVVFVRVEADKLDLEVGWSQK